jgi:adenylylsulfate kinase
VRRQHERFFEVYVRCPLKTLVERDVKGLYRKALGGDVPNFTGVSDPYEEPLNPELVIEIHRESREESLAKLIEARESLNYIGRNGTHRGASSPAGG